jgi:hypothetical protein
MSFTASHRRLQLRRERLRLRSAELRLTVGEHARVLEAPLALADQVRAGAAWLRANPEWPLGALALLVVLRPRRVFRWAGRLYWGWSLWRRGQRLLRSMAA